MKIFCSILALLFSLTAIADNKFSVEMTVDQLKYEKPIKGIGKAGILNFEFANINNNGIVLNINNANKYFNSQIFVRPTFLGFTTEFGNYGVAIEETSVLNQVAKTELQTAKLILDDSQLSLFGKYFSFMIPDTSVKLKNFLLYCQGNGVAASGITDNSSVDLTKSCFNFMSLNGVSLLESSIPEIEYEGITTTDKVFLKSSVKNFNMTKKQITAELPVAKIVSNDSFIINAQNVNIDCDRDEDLTELDFDKIKKACLNRLNLKPLKAVLVDKKQNTSFNLDVKNIVVKNKLVYFGLNSGALSSAESTTYLTNVLLNCRKELDSDLFELTHVLNDCFTYGRLSIGEIKSDNKLDPKKDSSNKNLIINADNGNLIIQASVRFLGMDHPVVIYGKIALDETKSKMVIRVTETKLPFGITSVKLLMYFLKKDFISKDIQIQNNIITISL